MTKEKSVVLKLLKVTGFFLPRGRVREVLWSSQRRLETPLGVLWALRVAPREPPRRPAELQMAPGGPQTLPRGAHGSPECPTGAPRGAQKPPRHGITKPSICTSVPGACSGSPLELLEASWDASGRSLGSASGLQGPPGGVRQAPRCRLGGPWGGPGLPQASLGRSGSASALNVI